MADTICYTKIRLYKYRLEDSYEYKTELTGRPASIDDGWVVLEGDGTLKLKKRYAWDGPSGPTIDTKNFMRGSLVHDALYQLMRAEKLEQSDRKYADQVIRRICREDGMSAFRAAYVYGALRAFAGGAAKPRPDPPTICAP
jgi:hypothetical protein